MSQRNITSFFKITPKKTATEESDKNDISPSTKKNNDSMENGDAKRLKRSRSISKENNSPESGSNSPVTPENVNIKKKAKRQRIESSESESESPSKSSSDEKEIKLEKSVVAKTYDSPKSKKSKATKKESSEKKIKVEKSSPKSEKTLEKEVKRSPLSKFTIKVEKNDNDKKSTNGDSGKVEIENDKKEDKNIEKEDKQDIVPEVDYNPGKSKYHPIKDACWVKGQPVPYLALAKTLEIIEATSARLKMVEILSNYFRSVIALTPEDLLPSIYLCLNQLGPAYDCLELGIAETYLLKAIGRCTGRSPAQARAAAARAGDLGALAQAARGAQRTMFAAPPLVLRKVFAALKDIASMTGHASVNKKIAKIQSLYVACRHSEARYLIRSLEGKLRIGLAEQSALQALARAAAATPPETGELDVAATMSADKFKALVEEYTAIVKTTYCECPDYAALTAALLRHGARALPAHCRLRPGRPLKPMLAHPTKGVHELFNRFENEEFTCEWKYDGERAQIHVPGDAAPLLQQAAIFSRNQENNTSKYPDVLRRLPALLRGGVRSCVLDCEAVAYDTAAKQILPFQVLSTRKRKDAAEDQIKVQVCVFVFDLLYLNGEPLVREPLARRRELLRENFNEVEGEWQFAVSRDCADEEEVQAFLHEAVAASCEGLMVKALRGDNARYDIARRSHNWLKLKKDYLEGVGDTIDAVVVGAYRGRGRRAGGYGGFLLACYDADADAFQSLCKLGTGFSDDALRALAADLDALRIDAPPNYYMYDASHAADVWFRAARVWELRCADLSLSPAHRAAAGLLAPARGVSLRFPRHVFVRVREDKTPEQATSARQLAALYRAQDQVRNCAPARPAHDDDEFY
ncbi:unnamed protein product, partial [Brenthis ino]